MKQLPLNTKVSNMRFLARVNLRNEYGLTLIELITALALISLVILGAFGIYFMIQNSYETNRAYFQATTAADKVIYTMEKDLRSSVVPNTSTQYPVRVITATAADADNPGVTYQTAQRVDIYTIVRKTETDPDDGSINATQDRYKRIRYSVEVGGTIRRGWVRQNSQPSGANPSIANISNWRVVASGVSNATGTAVPANVFSDANSPSAKSQRLISVSFWIKDLDHNPAKIAPVTVRTEILSGY